MVRTSSVLRGSVPSPPHERPVNLQRLDREPMQRLQRRISGAEVVDVQREAVLVQLEQHPLGQVGVVHDDGLGDLEHDVARLEIRFAQVALEVLQQAAVPELPVRDVDADPQVIGCAGKFPHGNLTARLAQNPPTHRHDESGLLGNRQELRRREQPTRRVLPTNECLERESAAGTDRDDRLVVQAQLAAIDRLPKLGLDAQSADGVGVHARVERGVGALLVGLRWYIAVSASRSTSSADW